MAKFTQLTRQEFPSTEATRQGQMDVAYVYLDERMRTFMFTIPIEEDTAERVREELEKRYTAAEGAGPQIIEL